MMRTFRPLAWLLLALAALSAPAAAQRSHIGGHGGYDFDRADAVVGGQVSLPFNRFLELYPSVDVYLVDTGSLLGFNGDLKYRLTPGAPLQLYVGGGLNVLRARAGGASTTDTGWDLFGGFESRRSYIHPYVEARALMHDRSTLQVNAGLNITLF
ncbi:MAG: hypothetical protein AUH42_06190 [Gemmatimonadetes bacterium 13_1_40CM_70_11]|nr:MAG: hypothetical protein AUH42_06190 [Gemmatimonadetes bacterium 13_1_40CM_70_11]